MVLKRFDRIPTQQELISSINNDPVGRNRDLQRLIRAINEIEGPFSIFLDAKWGDGKTFLVRQAELILQLANENIAMDDCEVVNDFWAKKEEEYLIDGPCLPVYFNAWENDDYADPLMPLLATIAKKCVFASTKTTEGVQGKIAAIIDSITGAAGHCIEAGGLQQAFSGKDMLDSYYVRVELRERFDLLAQASLAEVANKLILFIDELDRCRPAFAVKLLEQTKTLFANGNVVLVFSIDAHQLAHAVRGQYGQTFDAEKYLERFYDLRIEVSGVECLKYLRYIGFDDTDIYNYTLVTNGYIRLLQPTMRDANRLLQKLRRGQEYVRATKHDQFSGNAPLFVADGALLPTFIVMEFENHALWRRVIRAEDFTEVYDYASRNEEFVHVVTRLMQWGSNAGSSEEVSEEQKKAFIERICALLFISDHQDPRYLEAQNEIAGGMWGRFNIEAFRSLTLGVDVDW